jgi:hypothetical protein
MVSDLCLEKYGDAFAGNKISVLLEFCVLKNLESSRNIYVYKTECLFVYFVCKSTVLLRSWWNFVHLIFKTRRELLSTLILQKPTPTTTFNPLKKKRQFFRVGNTLILRHPVSLRVEVSLFVGKPRRSWGRHCANHDLATIRICCRLNKKISFKLK